MAYTKATMKAVDKYVRNNYDRLNIKLPKGRKSAVETRASALGTSVNAYVGGLIRADLGLSESEWKSGPSED